MRNRVLTLCVALAVSATLVALSGCQSGPAGPKTYPVTGTVTLDGNPVAGAQVVFVPAEKTGEAEPRPTAAVSDPQGRYKLEAVPGKYRIRVTKFEQPVTSEEDEMKAFQAAMQGQTPESKNALPPKYADEKTSGLEFTVEAKDNVFDIALSSS